MSAYHPSVEGIETPLGVSDTIWATSATHIGMSGTFTINRVRYRVRLDLHYRDGEWQRGDKDEWSAKWHALMVDREWDYPGGRQRPATSDAARKKAETLVPWLAEFASGEAAGLVRAAGVQHHTREIQAKRDAIAKLRAEIAQAEAELANLEQETPTHA